MLVDNSIPGDLRVENEMMSLKKAGHEVTVLSTGPFSNGGEVSYDWHGCRVVSREIPRLIRKSFIAHPWFPLWETWWEKFTSDIMRGNRFDAIHVHDLPLARLGTTIRRRREIPFILDLHENYPAMLRDAAHTKKPLGRILHSSLDWEHFEMEYIPEASAIISVCTEAVQRLKHFRRNDEPVIVQNTINLQGIPELLFRHRSRKVGVLRIFYGGGLYKHRGVQVLIEAVRILFHEMNRVVMVRIAGDGSYRGNLERQARDLPGPIVRFTGSQRYDTVLSMLRESKLAVIPNLSTANNDASSPHKLFQAMHAGVTVLASDCPSVKRIIDETGCGYTFRAGDAMALAKLIRDIDDDRSMLDAGERGTRAVEEKYNWEMDSKKLIDLYGRLY